MCVLFKIKAVVLYKKYLSGSWFESNWVFKCLNGIHIVPTTWYSFFVYLGRFSKKKQKKTRASCPLSAQVLLTCLFHDKHSLMCNFFRTRVLQKSQNKMEIGSRV